MALLQTADRVLCSMRRGAVLPGPVPPGVAGAGREQIISFSCGYLRGSTVRCCASRPVHDLHAGRLPRRLGLQPGRGRLRAAVRRAHHLGAHGEPFNGSFFAFRTAAGLYFAALYRLRGFGVAVGAHACYDVLVGLLLECSRTEYRCQAAG